MNRLFLLFLLLVTTSISWGQTSLTLNIKGATAAEQIELDKINYLHSHANYKSIQNTLAQIEATLTESGYLTFSKSALQTDNVLNYTYTLGPQLSTTQISTFQLAPELIQQLQLDKKINIPFQETKNVLNQIVRKLEEEGLGTSKVTLTQHRIKNDTLYCTLRIDKSNKRKLDKIEIVSTDKVPTAMIQASLKSELYKTYSETAVARINNKIDQFDFLEKIKPSETLFTQDSTAVYLYLKKRNTNQFDGYIGFNNEENGKIRLNGYLDLTLNNILNHGETFAVTWKNNGNKQVDFALKTEIPYIFKSSIALKGNIDIQKQDSTYQNTRLEIGSGYYFNYQSKAFLGYQTLNSATNSDHLSFQNYNSNYITASYEYTKKNKHTPLFPVNFSAFAKIGNGKRNTENGKTNQTYFEAVVEKNFTLNSRNFFYVQWNNYFLFSDNYLDNELKRFGGAYTLRGFAENSLSGKGFSILNTEYRFVLASNIFLNTLLDYAYQEEISNAKNHLYSFGFGMGMLTKNGKLQLSFANGKSPQQKMSFDNTTIHISMSTYF